VICLYFLATFCFACFESTFSLLVDEQYRLKPSATAYLFTYAGLLGAVVQAGLIGRLNKQFGERKLIIGSMFFVAISLALMPYVVSLTGILAAVGLFAVSSGVNRPPTFGLISLNSPANEQGTALGIAQSAASLARIFGPIFANAVYAVAPATAYLTCGGIAAFAAILAWLVLLQSRTPVIEGTSPHEKPKH
jgi:DHA1 family tetracycline resistance protein-like MFS transporter